MRNANEEFWMVAGARAIAKAPRSLIKSTLRHVISKNLMARAIIEVDRSNLKLVKKIEPYFEIRHYEPLDMQLYGIDDQCVAVGQIPVTRARSNQAAQLLIAHPPWVTAIRRFFDAFWNQSISLESRLRMIDESEFPAKMAQS